MVTIEKVKNYIIEKELIKRGEKIVVAFSGGPDSSCMLHILNFLSKELGFTIHIAYLNHTLRKASESETKWAQIAAKELSCGFTVGKYNVRWLSENKGLSIEDAARVARYRFLESVRVRIGADKIAVAHTLNDQIETILIHIIRGTSVRGISGMKAKNNSIIRPILTLTREEVETFCKENNIDFKIDETNTDKKYLRNRIRLELIPLLKERYNPAIESALLHLSLNAEAEDRFISEYAHGTFKNTFRYQNSRWIANITDFLNIPEAIQYRILLMAIEKNTGSVEKISRKSLESALNIIKKSNGLKKTSIAKETYIYTTQGKLFIGKELKVQKQKEYHFCPPYELETIFGLFKAEKITINDIKDDQMRNPNIALLDLNKLHFPLTIRTRMKGDRFHPIGAPGETKLKKFLINRKIPYTERNFIPLIISKDEIVWVVGIEISEKYKITEETCSILMVTFKPVYDRIYENQKEKEATDR